MKTLFIILFALLFIVPVVSAQDTLYVKTFDDLGAALEMKLKPLEQLKELPHKNCDCEECMVIKNKVADEVDAIVLVVDIKPNHWQSRTFHKRINKGMKKIEQLNELGDKIRSGEFLRRRHPHNKRSNCQNTLEN